MSQSSVVQSRRTLSMTQPPKPRKIANGSPGASQIPIVSKQSTNAPSSKVETIKAENAAETVKEDSRLGNEFENEELINVLSTVEGQHLSGEPDDIIPDKKAVVCEVVEIKTESTEENSTATATNGKAKRGSGYDSPRVTNAPGKVVRLAKGLRISPFRRAEDPVNVSTLVNLSTVSEQNVSLEDDDKTATDEGTDPAEPEVGESLPTQRISGRRTYTKSRPQAEISFKNATREAYTKNVTNVHDENSNDLPNDSVNATVGSELGRNIDDLPETPAVVGKKRRLSADEDEEDVPKPKRGLFDSYCVVM